MKRVLVTGGTGFVGSYILEELVHRNTLRREFEIFATRRYHLSRRDKVIHLEPNINWVDCDITDNVAVSKTIEEVQPDWCFNMASESFVSPSWDHPNRFMSVNYVGTVNLLEAIRRYVPNCRVLIPGSGEEYGDVHENELPITEHSTLRPVNPYAVTKVAQDLIGYVYHRSYDLNVIRLRTFNHEGPRREHYFGIASYCYQIAKIEQGIQDPTIRVGHLDDVRNFTHVKDIVKAYFLAMNLAKPGELYLVGSTEGESVASFREILHRLINMSSLTNKIDIVQVPEFTRPTAVPYLITDNSKFAELTGWKPAIQLSELLTETLDYWRNRVSLSPHL